MTISFERGHGQLEIYCDFDKKTDNVTADMTERENKSTKLLIKENVPSSFLSSFFKE